MFCKNGLKWLNSHYASLIKINLTVEISILVQLEISYQNTVIELACCTKKKHASGSLPIAQFFYCTMGTCVPDK